MTSTRFFDDPLTEPLWAAAEEGRLLLQRCGACGNCQHYPRPFCLSCDSVDLSWIDASGDATVHTATTVHLPVHPTLAPPYVAAVVVLDEGPRLTTNILGASSATGLIGSRVRLAWMARPDLPPVPVFEREST